ncbi:DUF2497 domain-containing protein [Pseudohoeflea sp. DP4N28-3]|uniref:DUF2497 domain-containing protein n=2 Tax=Pseudohoeflea coraliihabitans TaxID=2860393 RepID=A0ABS6WQ58_9HYPH|nr:DUF2497 domain-containing protein [Pseudohoeflea sp. DP4N28-3]
MRGEAAKAPGTNALAGGHSFEAIFDEEDGEEGADAAEAAASSADVSADGTAAKDRPAAKDVFAATARPMTAQKPAAEGLQDVARALAELERGNSAAAKPNPPTAIAGTPAPAAASSRPPLAAVAAAERVSQAPAQNATPAAAPPAAASPRAAALPQAATSAAAPHAKDRAPETRVAPSFSSQAAAAAAANDGDAPSSGSGSGPALGQVSAAGADAAMANPLISVNARDKVAQSFAALNEALEAETRRSFDEIAEDLLRPMLQAWLDDNLPTMVERLVREEIERVSRGNRR